MQISCNMQNFQLDIATENCMIPGNLGESVATANAVSASALRLITQTASQLFFTIIPQKFKLNLVRSLIYKPEH